MYCLDIARDVPRVSSALRRFQRQSDYPETTPVAQAGGLDGIYIILLENTCIKLLLLLKKLIPYAPAITPESSNVVKKGC